MAPWKNTPGVGRQAGEDQTDKTGQTKTGGTGEMSNPWYQNGNLRRKHRARFRAMGAECGICGGRLGPIRYDQPSDAQHPLSFVIDEIRPVARWRQYGYESAAAAANDWENLQAAHYCCNAAKGAKTDIKPQTVRQAIVLDGSW